MKRARISISSLAIAGLIGAGLSALPIGIDDHFAPEFKTADAKGKGSGKSGGKGGKGGKSGSRGADGDGPDLVKGSKSKNKSGDGETELDDDGSGNGHLKAKGNGHLKHDHADSDHDDDGSYGNKLGNLNAAHASPNARLHASENSMVGLLAAYADAVNSEEGLTMDGARAALGAISNKSYLDPALADPEADDAEAKEAGGVAAVDDEVVMEVNRLLGVNDLKTEPDGEDGDEEAN